MSDTIIWNMLKIYDTISRLLLFYKKRNLLNYLTIIILLQNKNILYSKTLRFHYNNIFLLFYLFAIVKIICVLWETHPIGVGMFNFDNIRSTLYPCYYIKTIFRLINWPIANCASVITFCPLLSLVINLFSTNIAVWHQWTSQSESFLKCPNYNWRNIIMNFQDIHAGLFFHFIWVDI
jgi:hypothetical protein